MSPVMWLKAGLSKWTLNKTGETGSTHCQSEAKNPFNLHVGTVYFGFAHLILCLYSLLLQQFPSEN